MIETKILGDAVGVQRGDVIDNSETTVLPSLANGVITGHFKRGRMDKPFKVTSSNYRSLLGYDPSNPSYLAVEDAFKRGISEISILRVGGMAGVIGDGGSGDGGNSDGGGDGDSEAFDWSILPENEQVQINCNVDNDAYFELEVNGVVHNKDGLRNLTGNNGYAESVMFSGNAPRILTIRPFNSLAMNVKMTPKGTFQKSDSTEFLMGVGVVQPNGTFLFRLKHRSGFGE